MRYKRYQFYFCEEDGRFLTVKNGVITSTANPSALPNSPDGWQGLTLAWQRDLKTLGITRQLSLPFGFFSDAAYILRKAFYQQSIERKIFLIVAKLEMSVDKTAQTYDPVYRMVYKGEIDPCTIKDGYVKVEASMAEGGLQKLLNANKATVYEYSLSDGDATVRLDGINLYQTGNFFIPFTDTQYRQNHFLDISFLQKEGEGAGISFSTELGGQVPFNYDYANGDNYFMRTSQVIQGIRIKGEVKMRPNQSDGIYTLYLWRTSGGIQNIATITAPTGVVTIPVDFVINSTGDEKFYIGASRLSTGAGIVSYVETTLTVSVKSKYRVTYAKAYTLLALYRKLIYSISGSADNALSELLAQYSNIKITSGDGLRSIEKAKIKTSLNEFFEFCYTHLFAGMGMENNKVVIEDRRHFLPVADPVELGEVRELEITEATDLLFNTVKVGYNPVDTDDVNGKSSFANSYTFSVTQTRVVKELTLICPYIADPYAIELTRINLDGKTTTDSDRDNKVFLLDAPNKSFTTTISAQGQQLTLFGLTNADDFTGKIIITGGLVGTYTVAQSQAVGPDVVLTVTETLTAGVFPGATISVSMCEFYRSSRMTITGVPDPETIFNIRLSAKRMLLRWMPWINSVLYRETGTKLTFVTTDKNADLKTVEDGLVIEEKASVMITTDRLFINKDFAFETLVPQNLHKVQALTPNRAYAFTSFGVRYVAFQRNTGLAPSDEKEQSFKMLSATSNDFKSLIHG